MKMKLPSMFAIAALLIMSTNVVADTEAPPRPWAMTSEYGDFIFKMVPAKLKMRNGEYVLDEGLTVVDREAYGVTYKITEDGGFEEVWRSEGWYCSEGYLSSDGRYFVRMGEWGGDLDKHTDLAVAFYDRGNLLKQYRVRDLIRKPELLSYSVSHYWWRTGDQTQRCGIVGGSFKLPTIDNTVYSFSLDTGDIIISEKNPDAGSVLEGKRDQTPQKAVKTSDERMAELLKESVISKIFLEQFQLTDIDQIHQVRSLSGPPVGEVWIANFNRKHDWEYDEELFFEDDIEVSIAIPIGGGKKLPVDVSRVQISEVIETACKHPYVGKLIDEGIESIRMHIRGDRFYWDQKEIEGYLERLTGRVPEKDELRSWANLVIKNYDVARFHSIYVNRSTGALIYEDESKTPWLPILLEGPPTKKSPRED